MILREFPDLTWLKRQTGQIGGEKQKGNFQVSGWPNVILTTKSKLAERPDIKGPLSLFFNLSGTSVAGVHNHFAKVDNNFFFLSNQEQEYTLNIESKEPVHTFNIHFGNSFADEVFQSVNVKPEQALDFCRNNKTERINFFNKAYRISEHLKNLIYLFSNHLDSASISKIEEEEFLALVMVELLKVNGETKKQVDTIPTIKSSTKVELYKRLSLAVDYIHFNYSEDISLESLSEISSLSKFHFLRLFKIVLKTSPYQYLNQIRIEKAKDLLRKTDLTVLEISGIVGFKESSSFSRVFKNKMGLYPSQFKTLVNN
jgi:AraC family transcriptional regulator